MKQRNLGIELLRIVSMFMVVLLHVVGAGGALENAAIFSVNYWVLYFIQMASFCAVNCFAIITGYVMYSKRAKMSKTLALVLQTLFYTVTITGIFFVLLPEARNRSMLLSAFLPITRKSYWYVSAYIGVCVLSPILNKALQCLSKKTLTLSFLTIFVVFSIVPSILSFASGDAYGLQAGYSTMWLCLMYLLGGYVRKYDIIQKIKSNHAWWMYMIAVCITFACNVFLGYATTAIFGGRKLESYLLSYTSPTIIIAALGLFVACAKLRISKKAGRVVLFISQAAFGVYLIHSCPPVWDHVIMGMTAPIASYNTFLMIGCVLGTAIAIYLICTAIELGRIYLFQLCRIDKLCLKAECAITRRIENSKWLSCVTEEDEEKVT